jgi:hypothetical protein
MTGTIDESLGPPQVVFTGRATSTSLSAYQGIKNSQEKTRDAVKKNIIFTTVYNSLQRFTLYIKLNCETSRFELYFSGGWSFICK